MKMIKGRNIYSLIGMTVLLAAIPAVYPAASALDDAMAEARTIESKFESGSRSLRGNSLDDYLEYAALNSPGLKAAFYSWKASLEKVPQISFSDPILSYGYFGENVETRVGPQEHRFSIRQRLPWPGTIKSGKNAAFKAAETAYQKYRSSKFSLYYKIKKAYYDLYLLGREIEIMRDNISLLEHWEAVARNRYSTGLASQVDVIKTQIELAKLENRLQTLDDGIIPQKEYLRSLIFLPDSIDIPVPDSIEFKLVEIDAAIIKKTANDFNPDLLAINHLVEKERAALTHTRKSNLPIFNIGLDYIATGEAINRDMEDSGKNPWVINFGISLPIWFGKNKSRTNEARARLIEAEHLGSSMSLQLEAIIEQKMYELRDAERRVELYQGGLIAKSEQSLNSTLKAYQTGDLDFLNVIDAQRQLLDFHLEMERALVGYAESRAELEMLIGKDIENHEI
ncbi:MAG: hypothetical protein DRP46_05280 [Candidatus Zixiibacteriota bacterium]|nr:MAG: hypothetical protein DRP46_05280 [candidate division Zixibacteria bacterium]